MKRHQHELTKLIERKYPGATCSWEQRKEHMRLVVVHDGRKAFVTLDITPSDHRGQANTLMCVKRAFRQNEAAQAG